jgi:hypothetical protein
MPISCRCLCLLACAAASSAALDADTRIYVRGESLLIEADVHAGLMRVLPLPPNTNCPPVATADGHYMAWLAQSQSAHHPMVFDVVSGGVADLTPLSLSFNSCPYSDPRAPRLLFPHGIFDRIWVVESLGLARPLVASGLEDGSIALGAGGELFYPRANDIGVMDVRSGALLRTIAPSSEAPSALAVSLDGQRLYVARSVASSPDLPSGGVMVTLHDSLSGATVAQFSAPGFQTHVPQLALDEAANRLLAVQTPLRAGSGVLFSLDAGSLVQTGRWSTALRFGGVAVDANEGRTYALTVRTFPFGGPGGCFESRLDALRTTDLTSFGGLTVFGSPDNTTTTGFCAEIGIATPPAAPAPIAATVSNRVVTLTWGAPARGVASDYQLEVGAASGASDLLVMRTGNRNTFVSEAPPGVYFVRLRALNVLGAGPASEELRVVVP